MTWAELKVFQSPAGCAEVCGHVLMADEVVMERVFSKPNTVYDGCATLGGHVVVVLSYNVTEELQRLVRCCAAVQCTRDVSITQ